jgi:hypothetical protein
LVDLEDVPRVLGVLGVNLASLRCHLVRFEGPPTHLGDPGQFLRDVPRGLGGPVGLKSKALLAPHGFEGGFWGLGGRGETRQENIRFRICGYVDKFTGRCKGLKD